MRRVKAIVEYDGSLFHGFQYQKGDIKTVQNEIEKSIFQITNEKVSVHAAGRTDAGVHSLGQTIHFDTNSNISEYSLKCAINHFLFKNGASIISLENIDNSFHARFSAKWRMYEYKILNRSSPSSLFKNHMWHVPLHLDVDKMKEAAELLKGTHDFNSFRASKCQGKSSIKTIELLDIERVNNEINMVIKSKSFLHNQVRIIMGTLYLIGVGKWNICDLKKAINEKKRCSAGPTAPPHGLYFKEVGY